MKYKYFVHYNSSRGSANCAVYLNKNIKDIKDINTIEKLIENAATEESSIPTERVTVQNYKIMDIMVGVGEPEEECVKYS